MQVLADQDIDQPHESDETMQGLTNMSDNNSDHSGDLNWVMSIYYIDHRNHQGGRKICFNKKNVIWGNIKSQK